MATVHYSTLTPADIADLKAAAASIMKMQTKVKPFGSEYIAILAIKENANVLAALADDEPIFPPSAAPTAY